MSRFTPSFFFAMKLWALFTIASALTAHGADIEWVSVGDAGNKPDETGYGAVAYVYEIGKTEVTVEAYAEFLNAVAAKDDPHQLWNQAMEDSGPRKAQTEVMRRSGEKGAYHYKALQGCEQMPVTFVSVIDAMRFVNWMHHGKGSGDTETGAYEMIRAIGLETHTKEARVWIATEDEWYKAAYFQPESKGGPRGGFWQFPTGRNEAPSLRGKNLDQLNTASFLDVSRYGVDTNHSPLEEVGRHPLSASPYGTLGQGGGVWEWCEGLAFTTKRVMRGGSVRYQVDAMRSGMRASSVPGKKYYDVGFRLARLPSGPEATGGAPKGSK
jgi:formylglycine-generating enzyme required for sulfatase activity